jgi:hypothetical protein
MVNLWRGKKPQVVPACRQRLTQHSLSFQIMRRKFSPDSRASIGLFVKALTS